MGSGGLNDLSDIVAGGALLTIVASSVGYLLRHQLKHRRSIPRRQIPATAAAALSLVAFVWFIAWTATDGLVPFGLQAFGVAAALAFLALVIGRRKAGI
jgi:hypothetical protein